MKVGSIPKVEQDEHALSSYNRSRCSRSPNECSPGFTFGKAKGLALIDLLLIIAFVMVSAALVWRLVAGGFVTEEIPLYVSALLIPIYWGAVTVQKNRLKRRRVEDDYNGS